MKFHQRFKKLHKKKWDKTYTLYNSNTGDPVEVAKKHIQQIHIRIRPLKLKLLSQPIEEQYAGAIFRLKRKYKGFLPRYVKPS